MQLLAAAILSLTIVPGSVALAHGYGDENQDGLPAGHRSLQNQSLVDLMRGNQNVTINVPNLIKSKDVNKKISSFFETLSQQWIEPLPEGSESCPLGFICNATTMTNCSVIRGLPIAYGFGDIHAGIWCPETTPPQHSELLFCPFGYYCPQPDQKFPCGHSYHCIKKSSFQYGYMHSLKAHIWNTNQYIAFVWVAVVLLLLLIAFGVWYMLRKFQHIKAIQLVKNIDLENLVTKVKPLPRLNKQQRDRVHLQLKHLVARLQDSNHDVPESFADIKSLRTNELFDILDKDKSGFVDIKELETALDLKPIQSIAFIRRFKELEGINTNKFERISRRCFVKHFISVLSESNFFVPNKEEVLLLWETISNDKEEVPWNSLYDSELSNFLSDLQIHELISKLKLFEMESSEMSVRHIRVSKFGIANRAPTLQKKTFVSHYADSLVEIMFDKTECNTVAEEEAGDGNVAVVDMAFQNLNLAVGSGENAINVVNSLTGRIKAKTMTALMGGSGAGKTSLLNALCGRANYGTTTGDIFINGHKSSVQQISDSTGFVPQDDIVFADLTVKENFMYSGMLRLPRGTPLEEIEELADETIASLGLARKADSMVGDVRRRGLSGGEKKRVNIGLELMGRPKILFLDEPTSGLDSSSAKLVMQSLKTNVERKSVTVVCVIHQPRKFIFELFDSLVLLNVGGNMVYHGPVDEAESYFGSLAQPYTLPAGENVADWLIDISAGAEEPSFKILSKAKEESVLEEEIMEILESSQMLTTDTVVNEDEAKENRDFLNEAWKDHFSSLTPEVMSRYKAPEPFDQPKPNVKPSFVRQILIQTKRIFLLTWRNRYVLVIETIVMVVAVIAIGILLGHIEVTAASEKARGVDLHYDELTSGNPVEILKHWLAYFDLTFLYGVLEHVYQYAMIVGAIVALILAVSASRMFTRNRLEFFRESGSGIDTNAYFIAFNIVCTVVQFIQAVITGFAALAFRLSYVSWYSFVGNYVVLMWLASSWAILISMLLPPENVMTGVAFYTAFCSLILNGSLIVKFKTIYTNPLVGIVCGIFSPCRYFVETSAVEEYRSLPAQYGWTVEPYAVNYPFDLQGVMAMAGMHTPQNTTGLNLFQIAQLAQNSLSVVQQTENGWYWGYLPALFVGLSVRFLAGGVIHISQRSNQAKMSLWKQLRASPDPFWKNKLLHTIIVYLLALLCMFGVTIFFILRKTGSYGLWDLSTGCNKSAELADPYLHSYQNTSLTASYLEAFPNIYYADQDLSSKCEMINTILYSANNYV